MTARKNTFVPPAPPPEPLIDKVGRLAGAVADAALSADVPFSDRLDALKTLTTYYVGVTKAKGKAKDEEDPDHPSFDVFRKRIDAAREEQE